MTKKKLTRKQNSEKQKRDYNRKWADDNKDYFKDYYQDHKSDYREAFDRYKETEKGQEAIARYENSPDRRKAKTEWMRKKREAERLDK